MIYQKKKKQGKHPNKPLPYDVYGEGKHRFHKSLYQFAKDAKF